MDGFTILIRNIQDVLGVFALSSAYLVGIYLLSIVFLISGTIKIRRPTVAAISIAEFGFRRRVSWHFGLIAGVGELMLGVGMGSAIVEPTLRILMPLCVTLVLTAFFVLILLHWLRGADFACFCFGSVDKSLSGYAVLRTGILAILAGLLFICGLKMNPEWAATDVPIALVCALSILGVTIISSHLSELWGANRDLVPRAERVSS